MIRVQTPVGILKLEMYQNIDKNVKALLSGSEHYFYPGLSLNFVSADAEYLYP